MSKKVSVAIIGSRGIPNQYGGFEELAEVLSLGLVEAGFEVYVYNAHNHINQNKEWHGVNIVHKYDPENLLTRLGPLIYDFNCIRDCRRKEFDVVLQLGYGTSAIWSWMIPKKSKTVTNMDGMEWKRAKYGWLTRKYVKLAEKLAVKWSNHVVADSIEMQRYLSSYQKELSMISYGADIFDEPDQSVLKEYDLEPYGYNMLIARMVPENSIEMILNGVINSQDEKPFLVIGNQQNKYGRYIAQKFDNPKIQFLGPLFDKRLLNNLRYFSNLYFHGHKVGGTNPSLLEAMASHAFICAHDNVFNRSVLKQNGLYFKHSKGVIDLLDKEVKDPEASEIYRNLDEIKKNYSWSKVIKQYFDLFSQLTGTTRTFPKSQQIDMNN